MVAFARLWRRQPNSESAYQDLQPALMAAGIPRREARRLTQELDDHYEDLTCEALANGLSHEAAAADARERLGSYETLASLATQEYGAKGLLAGNVLVISTDDLHRWCVAVCGSASFTAGLFFVLQFAIRG